MDFLKDDLEKFIQNPHYGIRIASILRVLLHDSGSSVSLLSQLAMKEKIKFLDTCEKVGRMPVDNFSKKNIGNTISLEDYTKINPFRGLTAEYAEEDIVRFRPFFQHLQEGGFDLDSFLQENFDWIDFDTWWNTIVYINASSVKVSRKYMIIKAANKDGGAHYDAKLPEKYISIKDEKIRWPSGYVPETLLNSPLYASIFQIGWEVYNSIEQFNA